MVWQQKIILQYLRSQRGALRPVEALWKYCMQSLISTSWGVSEFRGVCERGGQSSVPPCSPPSLLRFYVLITPLLGSCLGRQGSSGRGSWAKTESSPEEQVLFESWQVGEYCSKGTARSRYSCQGRGQRSDSGVTGEEAVYYNRPVNRAQKTTNLLKKCLMVLSFPTST